MRERDQIEALWRVAVDRPTPVVCLVRHGQTEWNVRGRFLGRTDLGLDAVGRQQAAAFARALPLPFAAVYASPLRRAVQTAAPLHDAPRLEPAFVELDQGEIEGLDAATALARHPDFFAQWQRDPTHAIVPGGESLGAVQSRALQRVHAIAAHAEEPGPIAIFTHQMVIAGLTCAALDEPLSRWRAHRVGNTEVTMIAVEHGRLHLVHERVRLPPVGLCEDHDE